MKHFLILGLFCFSCNGGYDQTAESEHVNNLNKDRLNGILAGMIQHIKSYKFTHDPDLDYVGLLKIHHITAVQLAEREAEWGQNDTIVKFAKQLMQAENSELNIFDEYEHIHKPDNQNLAFFEEAHQSLLSEGLPNETGNIDHVFVKLIRKHHEKAILISEIYLRFSKDKLIHELAIDVIHHHKISLEQIKGY